MIVVDASVAIKWVVEETGSDEAEALIAADIHLGGPDILVPEVVNVLRKKVKRRELSERQALLAAQRVFEPIGRFAAVDGIRADLLGLARRLDHPAYDCAYIHCAGMWDATLVTADAVLERKCIEAGRKACGLADWRRSLAR